ncbi:IS5 family transposase [Streptomyces phaeochromogenes]
MGNRQPQPWIASHELWSLIAPLLPEPAPKLVAGRPQVPDRQALCGILFVPHTGIQWEYLPHELGFGSGVTCWRRSGRVERGGRLGPPARRAAERTAVEEPARQVPDGGRLLPRPGHPQGAKSGPCPVDRARPGSKHHVLTDGQGIPLAVSLTGGNRNDVTQLLPLLDKVPAVADIAGRPRRRPDMLFADRRYDHEKYRRSFADVASAPRSPNEDSPMAPARAPSAGSSSARSPGSTASLAYASAGNDETTSTKRSFHSPSA